MIEDIRIEMKLDGQCEEYSLHSYNIAEISTECKRSLQTETIATDALRFSITETVENPLASLARFILYHAATFCIIQDFWRASAKRERIETTLNKGGHGGNENHSQLDMTSEISAIFWPYEVSFEPFYERHILVLSIVILIVFFLL